jgi:hypothetical protein
VVQNTEPEQNARIQFEGRAETAARISSAMGSMVETKRADAMEDKTDAADTVGRATAEREKSRLDLPLQQVSLGNAKKK